MSQFGCAQGSLWGLAVPVTCPLQARATVRQCPSSQLVRAMSVASKDGLRRFAVLGAGFAGVSVAWHLLQHTTAAAPVCVELYDEGGIGAGASGVSGGLLHPYNPQGSLLWKGAEGFAAALKLIEVAELYSRGLAEDERSEKPGPAVASEPIAWRRGIVRPAILEKHAAGFRKNVKPSSGQGVLCLDSKSLERLVPGLRVPTEDRIALHMPLGINVHPERYLQALWLACRLYSKKAEASGCVGTQALLHQESIQNLSSLAGRFEAVVVCVGARASLLPELAGKLPISFCRGIVADLQSPASVREEHPEQTPSILANTWLAVQGRRNMVMGATKEWGPTHLSTRLSLAEATDAYDVLVQKTKVFYPLISRWEVLQMRAGVRAMPPRTHIGALPLVGCIDKWVMPSNSSDDMRTKFWFFGGLGARGLVYHGLIGEQVAQAVVTSNAASVFVECRQWIDADPTPSMPRRVV